MAKNKIYKIKLNGAEIQGGYNRVDWAEGLILQLPPEHEGRNSWLLNYGRGPDARRMRKERGLVFVLKTLSCETTGLDPELREKYRKINEERNIQ